MVISRPPSQVSFSFGFVLVQRPCSFFLLLPFLSSSSPLSITCHFPRLCPFPFPCLFFDVIPVICSFPFSLSFFLVFVTVPLPSFVPKSLSSHNFCLFSKPYPCHCLVHVLFLSLSDNELMSFALFLSSSLSIHIPCPIVHVCFYPRTAALTCVCKILFNPHQNDQGRKGPCYFQRLIALKCLKCQKI
jgi:hypothetical protein